ncbi:MAG TPA: lipid-binding SYLF domain-containing protein [Thermoanaerobaculia bacterium]|nr:lipid-binding SYLF domain-containing protein [Thermoanaerobaculia bacterium]
MPRRLHPRALAASLVFLCLSASTPALGAATLDQRIELSTEALTALLNESPPPRSLLEKTTCIAVLPRVIRAALGVGGRHGKGVMSCRREGGEWSPPVFLKMSGGSLGLQLGAEASDVVLLIVDPRSARSLLRSKFTIGADAKAAAGPRSVGAEATTDARLDAEIYSYASSKGFFAGVSLGGAKLKLNRKQVSNYYPERPLPEDLLFGRAQVRESPAVAAFREALP